MGKFHPPEDVFDFDDDEIAPGVYRLAFHRSLASGEYALVAAGGSTGYLIYDFAVD
jgi:hypothetical protein